MREDYSRTAEGMPMVRALEQAVASPGRIINDPFAKESLINRRYRRLAASRTMGYVRIALCERSSPDVKP